MQVDGQADEHRRPLRRRATTCSITNLTGHPTAVLPHGFRDDNGRERPGSITFTGQLYGESTLLAVAVAFQKAVGDHLKRPPLERYLAEEAEREQKEKAEKEAKEKAEKEKPQP